jgi:gatB/yqey family protein|nr:MAG TPA: YqeY-like protein [Caudoviricetes sp.]
MFIHKINGLIKDAMKMHDDKRRDVLRLIKSEVLKYETSKEGAGHELTDAVEFTILKKMVDQRKDSIAQYKKYGKPALAKEEQDELNILLEYLPTEATAEEIANAFNTIVSNGLEPIKKNMGQFIKGIKVALPTADGKKVADYVKANLK